MVLSQKKYSFYFYIITISLAVPKILFTLRPEVNLFTEEAQYWLWSQNMAWHYYSKPPLVAVINFLSTSVLGNTEMAVRINAILSGVGIAWVTFLFGSYLYTRKVGFWAALIVQSMPVWWLASTFHMTDSSLTLFWTLSIYLGYRGIKENSTKWWLLAGLATAMGLMAKVVIILIFPVLIIYLIYLGKFNVHKENFLKFILVSLLGFIPALVWNWQNNFDTFRHLFALSGTEGINNIPTNLSIASRSFIEFILSQIAVVSLFLLPAWVAAFLYTIKSKGAESIYLILPGLLAFLTFAGLSIFKEAMINWPAFAYIGLAIVLANWMDQQSRRWKTITISGVFLGIFIPVVFLSPDYLGFKSSNLLIITEQNLIKRLLGHEQLADRIDFLADSLAIDLPFVFSDSYHTASELSFYLSGNPQTYVINMGARKNQFDLWPGMDQFLGKEKFGVFVSWNFDNFKSKAVFQELIYEETFVTTFKGIPRRPINIKFCRNLIEYTPSTPSSY
ncbi:ArnT family glycosyltransferase [Cyclobacterium sediminis]